MRKIIIVFCLIFSLLTLSACGKQTVDNHSNSNSSPTTSNSTESENLSKWQMAGKGVGKILPEPKQEYSLPQSSSFIVAEIENTTYAFFEDYVNQCRNVGFEGTIGTAESPDYYYNGETTTGERVQVMFYEDDSKVSISAFPAD